MENPLSFQTLDPIKAQLTCQICNFGPLERIFDFGYQPLCNRFLPADKINQPQIYYPLCLYYCFRCMLGQLGYILPTSEVFSPDFNYLSGATRSVVRFFAEFAAQAKQRFRLSERDLVLDIGSNDGSLLKEFQKFGIKVLGIEGAPKPAQLAIEAAIPTIVSFFDKGIKRRILEITKPSKIPRLITAFNVLAHTDNIHSFLEEVVELMDEETVFVSQSHYFMNLLRRSEFDTIYHEHLRYYTLTAMVKLFQMHGLTIFDADLNELYGGSLFVCARRHSNPVPASGTFLALKQDEETCDIAKAFEHFRSEACRISMELPKLLSDLRQSGKRVVGIGAPMKSSTLLNLCRITRDLVSYLAEVNPLKVGTYSPGACLPVLHEDVFFRDHPDYALILAWNATEDIVPTFRARGYKGGFILPLPELKVVH